MTKIEVKLPIIVKSFRIEQDLSNNTENFLLIGSVEGIIGDYLFEYGNRTNDEFKKLKDNIIEAHNIVNISVDVELNQSRGFNFQLPSTNKNGILIKKIESTVNTKDQDNKLSQDIINKEDAQVDESETENNEEQEITVEQNEKDKKFEVDTSSEIDEVNDNDSQMQTIEVVEESEIKENSTDEESQEDSIKEEIAPKIEDTAEESEEHEESYDLNELYNQIPSGFLDEDRPQLLKFTKHFIHAVFEKSKKDLVPIINLIVIEAKADNLSYEEFKNNLVNLSAFDEGEGQLKFFNHFNKMPMSNKLKMLYISAYMTYKESYRVDELIENLTYIGEVIGGTSND